MDEIHFGSRHPLHYLLALFSSSRTQPKAEENQKQRNDYDRKKGWKNNEEIEGYAKFFILMAQQKMSEIMEELENGSR